MFQLQNPKKLKTIQLISRGAGEVRMPLFHLNQRIKNRKTTEQRQARSKEPAMISKMVILF
jgi:hypothetical protein